MIIFKIKITMFSFFCFFFFFSSLFFIFSSLSSQLHISSILFSRHILFAKYEAKKKKKKERSVIRNGQEMVGNSKWRKEERDQKNCSPAVKCFSESAKTEARNEFSDCHSNQISSNFFSFFFAVVIVVFFISLFSYVFSIFLIKKKAKKE